MGALGLTRNSYSANFSLWQHDERISFLAVFQKCLCEHMHDHCPASWGQSARKRAALDPRKCSGNVIPFRLNRGAWCAERFCNGP